MGSRPSALWRRQMLGSKLNESDSAEDDSTSGCRSPCDSARSPPFARPANGLRPSLSWTHLVGVTFFAVCGGDYGLEDSVGAGGAALTLIGVVVLPWVWSLPIALMTAELGSMIPEAGGCVVWVHRALGPFWAQQNAAWNLVSNTFDNALYPVMFVDYLLWFPALRVQGFARWCVSVMMLATVTCLNLLGVDVVASASNVFALLVISPFVGLVVAGIPELPTTSSWLSAVSPMESDPPIRWGPFLSVLLWNTSGYDSVGALAAEVQRPGRDFPIAMIITIVLVTVVYFVPLAVAVSLDAKHTRLWSDGHFVSVASNYIGDWLAAWITIGGALSAVGLLNTLMCTSARVAVSAARLRVLPASLASVHEKSGTPRHATLAIALVLSVACALPFSQLVSISMLFYGATTLTEFLALIVLRKREPLTPRPFRVPLSGTMLLLASIPSMSLCLLLICLAPLEAWMLLLASSGLALFAYARGHYPQWVPCADGSPDSVYGSVDTSARAAQLMEARAVREHGGACAGKLDTGPETASEVSIVPQPQHIEIAPAKLTQLTQALSEP